MIEVTSEGALTIVTLNRPDKANALTRGRLAALADTVERTVASQETRALVLTGEGKVFSAGADLDEARAGLATDPVWERLSGAIAEADILADFYDDPALFARRSADEITIAKNGGGAHLDLMTATYIAKAWAARG